jgi:hypothetical protein
MVPPMLKPEAHWLRDELAKLPDEDLFPLLNLGSSTGEFRTTGQPHIDSEVFAPLRARGGNVIHVDMKEAEGVDMAGDLTQPEFMREVMELRPRSVMVSNLLEHVVDRKSITDAVLEVLPAGGLVIATGPYKYPKHEDPIDTMFRVDPEGAAELFPGTSVVAGAVIDAGRYGQWRPPYARSPLKLLRRAAIPYPGTRSWRMVVPYVPYLVKHAKAFGVILRKH